MDSECEIHAQYVYGCLALYVQWLCMGLTEKRMKPCDVKQKKRHIWNFALNQYLPFGT